MLVSGPSAAAKSVTYYYVDPQGTVLATTNDIGEILTSSDYMPFGIRVPAAYSDGVGFLGQVEDLESGLDYLQARYYDPLSGLFISADPLPTDGESRVSRYAYANFSPYVFMDPGGMDADPTSPPTPPVTEPPVIVTATVVNAPSIPVGGGEINTTPSPETGAVKRPEPVCSGVAYFSAIGPKQAPGFSAIYTTRKPKVGSVAINPGSFGLSFAQGDRGATKRTLRALAGAVTIEAPGLNTSGRHGPGITSFSIGDIGDANIRNSPNVRFDIYRWGDQKAAVAWGKRSSVVVIKGLKAPLRCPW